MAALEELADARALKRAGERLPDAVAGSDLRAVDGQTELRIGTQKGGNFLRPRFLHIEGIGLQGRIRGFEFVADLRPGVALLRPCNARRDCQQGGQQQIAGLRHRPIHRVGEKIQDFRRVCECLWKNGFG